MARETGKAVRVSDSRGWGLAASAASNITGVEVFVTDEVIAGRPVPLTLSGTAGDNGAGEPILRFVHISDTHISASRPLEPRHRPNSRHHPNDHAERLLQALNDLPFHPDFVLHTGDLANGPEPEHHEVAIAMCQQIRWPCFYIAGNHDDGDLIRKHRITTGCEDWRYRNLPDGGRALQTATNLQTLLWERVGAEPVFRERRGGYSDWTDDNSWFVEAPRRLASNQGGEHVRDRDVDVWQVGEVDIIAVDSERDPDSDTYTEDQLQAVSTALSQSGAMTIVAVHHPINVTGSPWHDVNMRLQNGNELHEVLRGYADRIVGVFSGHSHEHAQWVRDGILYSGVQSPWYEHVSWPHADRWYKERDAAPCYQVVTVWSHQTHVRQYRVR